MKIYTRTGTVNLNNIEIKPYNNNPYTNPNKFQFGKIDVKEYFWDSYCFELLPDTTYRFWVEHRDIDGIFDSEEIELSDEDKNYIKTLHQEYMGSMLKSYIDTMKGAN